MKVSLRDEPVLLGSDDCNGPGFQLRGQPHSGFSLNPFGAAAYERTITSAANKKGGFSAALFVIQSRSGLLAGRFARGGGFRRLLLGLEVLAGGLIDHLHRQPRLAAI